MKTSIPTLILGLIVLACTPQLNRLTVEKNQFVNTKKEKVVLRGVNTSDPDKLEKQGYWSKAYFQEIKDWGANVVRFPVHPSRWRERGKENYLKLLDKGVLWASGLDMYVIIDWHSIGNLKDELFFKEGYKTDLEETKAFWEAIAAHFGDNPTVAFYELFNEPTVRDGELGQCTWDEWKEINEELIAIIRKNGGKGIPLVAGFNWAYDLSAAYQNPIDAEGIGYVSHPYPQKREKPWEDQWTADWGHMKEKYPVILTEMGFAEPEEKGAHIPVISDESYGVAITDYCDSRDISYVVWVFDPHWAPGMFSDWNYTPTRHGKYFKEKFRAYR